jgi:hypothetical protein
VTILITLTAAIGVAAVLSLLEVRHRERFETQLRRDLDADAPNRLDVRPYWLRDLDPNEHDLPGGSGALDVA